VSKTSSSKLPRTGPAGSAAPGAGRNKLEKHATSTRKLLCALIVPLNSIVTNSRRVRTVFDEKSLGELAEDIKEHGILEPLLVLTITPDGSNRQPYPTCESRGRFPPKHGYPPCQSASVRKSVVNYC
jgi:hypothetical protein